MSPQVVLKTLLRGHEIVRTEKPLFSKIENSQKCHALSHFPAVVARNGSIMLGSMNDAERMHKPIANARTNGKGDVQVQARSAAQRRRRGEAHAGRVSCDSHVSMRSHGARPACHAEPRWTDPRALSQASTSVISQRAASVIKSRARAEQPVPSQPEDQVKGVKTVLKKNDLCSEGRAEDFVSKADLLNALKGAGLPCHVLGEVALTSTVEIGTASGDRARIVATDETLSFVEYLPDRGTLQTGRVVCGVEAKTSSGAGTFLCALVAPVHRAPCDLRYLSNQCLSFYTNLGALQPPQLSLLEPAEGEALKCVPLRNLRRQLHAVKVAGKLFHCGHVQQVWEHHASGGEE